MRNRDENSIEATLKRSQSLKSCGLHQQQNKQKPGLSLFTCVRLSKVILSAYFYFPKTYFSKVERICVGLHPMGLQGLHLPGLRQKKEGNCLSGYSGWDPELPMMGFRFNSWSGN